MSIVKPKKKLVEICGCFGMSSAACEIAEFTILRWQSV